MNYLEKIGAEVAKPVKAVKDHTGNFLTKPVIGKVKVWEIGVGAGVLAGLGLILKRIFSK